MTPASPAALDELVRASSLLSEEISFSRLVSVLVEQALDITRSDTAALYLYSRPDGAGDLELAYRRGRMEVSRKFPRSSELIAFVEECGESVVLLSRKQSPFDELFLVGTARSGMALPIASRRNRIGVLILNSSEERHYNRERLSFLDSLVSLAAGMLTNARLHRELQDYVHKIEELERYQESIFESMTNLLVTTDAEGRIHYFNRAAAERLSLEENHLGESFDTVFAKGFSKKVMNSLERATGSGESILGIEGIYKRADDEMDFGLNISPLRGKRGRHEGLTLLFTDQTAEKDLRAQMRVVSEERRIIKDMFASYLSEDIVKMLVEHPELVKPGGGAREATVFFADIAGYTSFSEGRPPEDIVTMLNEFFEEAEPLVRKHHGYLDKYIGDCIMAVFGVPLDTGPDDTISAVRCAIELQELVNHPKRPFFTGEAEHLRIQIGMHSGPVVAGNIGGSRRMDFTEIGDTVNVAARLEGVARAGEIIISAETREQIGDQFRIEHRKPARVKGKAKPIQIYNVLGMAEA